MRHSIKRISKSALSVILALMMVVSTMVVGIVTVSAVSFDLKGTYNFDNYTARWDKVYLVKVGGDGKYTEYQEMTAGSDGIYSHTLGSWNGSSFYFANSNSNPTATTEEFTSAVDSTNNCFVPSTTTGIDITGSWMTKEQAIANHSGSDEPETAKFNGGDVYYLQPNDNYWNQAGAWFAICLKNPISGSTNETWVKMDQVTGASTVTYKVTIPDGGWNNMDFCRMNKNSTALNYGNIWNNADTGNKDVGYPSGTQNCLKITNWNNSGTWSTFVDKINLPKPELSVLPQYIDLTSESKTVTLSVSNASSYPTEAKVTYSFYQVGNDKALYTGENSSFTVDVATEGTYNYYVTINSYDTDNYTCADATSERKSVTAVTPVTVSVSAGANGKAYVSSYTTYDNQTKSNTDTALISVKVAPNSNVTFTAVPNEGYAVGAWSGSESSGSKTYTVSNVTSETNVSVSFVEETYVYSVLTASGEIEMTPSAADSNVFYSTDTVAKDAIFRIKRTFGSEVKYSVNSSNSSTTWWFNKLSMKDVIPSWDGSDSVDLNAGNYKNATDSAYYVKFDASTGTVSLSESTVGGTTVKVKAMNGVPTLLDLGTTVAEAANSSSSVIQESANLAGGTQYKVTKGSTVKVTTTMAADTTTAEKFVYAYVINNKDTYLATEGIAVTKDDKKYATYSAQFTIDEDTAESIFTVYPIYYYKACAKDGEYIKFYVDKSDTKSWGNNLYNYAYYYKTAGDTEDLYRSDGTWPGQPMLYDATKQLYYSLVPKQIGGKLVSGLTVNIGSDTLQSFDFDDFKVINEIGYDIVRLDLKQRSGHSSNKVKLGVSYDDTNNVFNDLTYDPANLVSDFSGRWEAYKDINGNDVSLIGKAVNTDNTNTTYIVSSATHTSGERGQWMSAFSVYKVANDGTVTYVTTAFPSDFIPRLVQDGQTGATANTPAYNAILDNGLGDAPVKIVYEDQVSTRIDGRWYYAQSDSEVSAYAYYRTYETTDCSGTPSHLLINKDYSKIIAETELINDEGIVIGGKNSTLRKEISVVSSPLSGYIFDHWSVADKAGNITIDKLENVGSSFTTTLDQEVHYVANFRKATQGQIEIKHSKYSGVGAKNGLGYYRLEVKVLKEDGTWTSVATGSGTGANGHTVKISDLTENDKIVRIKLITETAGENTFRYWYTDSSDGTEIIEDPDGEMTWKAVDSEAYVKTTEPTGKKGILTYTFDTEVWKLFSGKISQLNFYSDIAPMNKNYKLTYIYDDRFGNPKSYVVTGTHDDSYYINNMNSWAPSDELIAKNAPPIDDLYKNCKWVIANSNKDGTDATLVAVQNQKTYKVDIYDASGVSESFDLPINSYVINKYTDNFFVADEKDANDKSFSYWAVYKRLVDENGKAKKGEEVARHFYREYTLVVLDDYWIEPVYGAKKEDKVYISAPQYTREKYSNEEGKDVKDTLYADFMVAYMSSNGTLIRDDSTGEKYKTGLIIEIGQNQKLTKNEDETVNKDFSGINYGSNTDRVKEAAMTDNGTITRYTYAESDKRKLFNLRATNTNYNNLNRLDYAVLFSNTETNRMYVMKAYYYVIVGGEVILSNPVYFNLYEIGTSDPDTVK